MKGKAKMKGKPAPQKKRAARRERAEEKPSGDLDRILHEVVTDSAEKAKPLDHWEQVQCPYCGDSFELHVEAAEDGQTMYEDCHMCCKPISLHIQVEDEEVHISVARA